MGLRSRLIDSIDRRNSVLSALFPPWTWAVKVAAPPGRRTLRGRHGSARTARQGQPLSRARRLDSPQDSIDQLGPARSAFPFISWVGGAVGKYMQAAAILVVLQLNRRAWLLAWAATAGGVCYFFLVGYVNRPRPTASQVLHITEHPGASSFPSGHVIFSTLSLAIVMLCVGHRYLPS